MLTKLLHAHRITKCALKFQATAEKIANRTSQVYTSTQNKIAVRWPKWRAGSGAEFLPRTTSPSTRQLTSSDRSGTVAGCHGDRGGMTSHATAVNI